jgi:hypothetical protein
VRHPRAEIVLRDLERAYISLHYIYEDFKKGAERAFRAYEILKGCYGEVEVLFLKLWRSWGRSKGDC